MSGYEHAGTNIIISLVVQVDTPLKADKWESMLWDPPDQEFARYLVQGIKEGFHIGFDRDSVKCCSAQQNMQSAIVNPSVVTGYLKKECRLGRVVGPLPKGSIDAHVWVIPKSSQPGKWHLIIDLSHPEGGCVNEGIRADLCSLVYCSIDNAVDVILDLGQGSLLAKMDLESAYQNVPVHLTTNLCWEWYGRRVAVQLIRFSRSGYGLRPKISQP